MLRPSRRGGVPVLRRQPRSPRFFSASPSSTALGSPLRPAGYCCSPQWMSPLRNVPGGDDDRLRADGAAVAEDHAANRSFEFPVSSFENRVERFCRSGRTAGRSTRARIIGLVLGREDSGGVSEGISTRNLKLETWNCAWQLLEDQIRYFRLLDVQIGLGLQHFAHLHAILLLVTLRPWRPHRRTARRVQQSELDADRVRHLAHNAAQCIHFADEVPLGDAADGGIARHLGDKIDVERVKCGLQAHARSSHGSLASGMTGTDHDHVVRFGELRQRQTTPRRPTTRPEYLYSSEQSFLPLCQQRL